MARVSISNSRVRDLVENRLVPLFLAERSTAAMCRSLNRLLGPGAKGTIHPNRLHAMLSDDIARGVNEATVGLIEQAIQVLDQNDANWIVRADKRLAELRAEVSHLSNDRRLGDEDVIRRLTVPPAVARRVFGQPLPLAVAPVQLATSGPRGRKRTQPDWSFQDVAVSNCLDAFRQRPYSKVGLILPTGAGKTRTALRIVLQQLAKSADAKGLVYWVTHRKNLRTQAHRELQKLLSTGKELPEQSAALLAERIKFVMVSELPQLLAPDACHPVLVVVDEAHHAAAPSYQPIFTAKYPIPALFLTATPNRTDLLPIGIDEIAFTITYHELEDRGCIVMPQFDPFPVDDFEWSESQVEDLADYVIDHAEEEFRKILVLAPRVERVEEFYEALLKALADARHRGGHPLDPSDIGFIHGSRNSLYIENDDFLDIFAEKPRAIMVSAQLLLEGFDDPAIDTVVLTYPTQSLVRLMQAAGRCVRYSPGKNKAYVIQARKDELAYYFDQRWLYQEISDRLRPDLEDLDYANIEDLATKVAAVLTRHNVKETTRKRILARLVAIIPSQTCRLLLYGLPYFGSTERFEKDATWGGFLEDSQNSAAFRGVFNAFSAQGATLSDPSEFLTREGARYGVPKDITPGSMWASLMEVLTASHFAREELYGFNPMAKASRPSQRHGPTTWLRYITFRFRPLVPAELSDFLADCYNREPLLVAYLEDASRHALAIKIPLPLGGHEGYLLSASEARGFESSVVTLLEALSGVPPQAQITTVAGFVASRDDRLLPARVLFRIEAFLGEERAAARTLRLPHYPAQPQGDAS